MQHPAAKEQAGGAMAAPVMPQSKHERLKMRWDETWGPSDRPFRHDKTAVLQLSWKQEHDDLNVGSEVSQLGNVFRDRYGFSVRHATLDIHKAEQQALMELSAFVHAEDEERALLIIYYAGHGQGVAPGDMRLEGKSTPNSGLEGKTSIVWSKVETAISTTEADVLLIFDCCDAGRLSLPMRNALPKSYFQFLGACAQNETTQGPGDGSFTSALISALDQLAQAASPFSTAELRARIVAHKKFPHSSQTPILTQRRPPYENIIVSTQGSKHAALGPAPSVSEREKEMEKREHIDLRFHFDHNIDDEHIVETAEGLKQHLQRKRPHWIRVSFLAKSSEYLMVQRYATRWRENTLVGRKRELSFTTNGGCPQALTNGPASQSPMTAIQSNPFDRTDQPPRLLVPDSGPRELSPRQDGDGASHMSGWTEVAKESSSEDSVMFHVRAIVRTLRLRLSSAFSKIARWLLPRSGYERIPEEETA